MTETQIQYSSRTPRITEAFRSFVGMISVELPRVDVDLVMNWLLYNYKYKEERPRVRLEIVYIESINAGQKKEEIYARTGRVAEIREGHILIIDGYFRLQDIEELSRDNEIRVIKGEITSW